LFRPHNDPDDHWDLACAFALAKTGLCPLAGVLIDFPPGHSRYSFYKKLKPAAAAKAKPKASAKRARRR